ncbi:alcohol dehydrogenase [Catellatospora sp. IY07-71]|nr:alcohol dehydrogenase [Catellatospora sp. IY07-71]
MMLALQYKNSPVKYLTARGVTGTRFGSRFTSAVVGNLAPLQLTQLPVPDLPGRGWVRLRPLLSGICGSDLAMLTGRSSPYLTPLVSTPFVPGHEVVAVTLDDAPDLPKGSRVVVDPVLSCAARGLRLCPACAEGRQSRCIAVTSGGLAPGLQTGYCGDTGGGWGKQMVAHRSQLHVVPEGVRDELAVLAEPLACAIHAVRRVALPAGATVVVIGAGTVGLLTILALREYTEVGGIHVVAKHRHQQVRARQLGATEVIEPGRAARAVRRLTGGSLESPVMGAEYLLGGADVTFECTGGGGLDTALRLTRAGGTVVLTGMPSTGVDLTPLWFRELHLVGAYATDSGGVPEADGGRQGDFDRALDLVGRAPLDGFVDARYPLTRWREAVGHAADAGRLGTVKVAFDLAEI